MRWYLLNAVPQKEFAAESILSDAGYHVVVPLAHRVKFDKTAGKVHRRAKRQANKIVTHAPQYPGYVFIAFEHEAKPDWEAILRFKQVVIDVIRDENGAPWPVPDQTMLAVLGSSSRPMQVKKKFGHRPRDYGRAYASTIVSGPYEGRPVRVIEFSPPMPGQADRRGEVEVLYDPIPKGEKRSAG